MNAENTLDILKDKLIGSCIRTTIKKAMPKILTIEDDAEIRNLIRMTLSTAGMEYCEAACGEMALQLIQEQSYDLILLDLGLPIISGHELIRHIDTSTVPVIVLTVRNDIADKIRLFENGAIDYIVKPFDPMELLLRIKSALKRIGPIHGVLWIDRIAIDSDSRIVSVPEGKIDLTPKEFDLLLYLAQNQGVALSRDRILEKVWGYDSDVATRTVDIHVGRLRSKIPRLLIKTLHRSGYRLEET